MNGLIGFITLLFVLYISAKGRLKTYIGFLLYVPSVSKPPNAGAASAAGQSVAAGNETGSQANVDAANKDLSLIPGWQGVTSPWIAGAGAAVGTWFGGPAGAIMGGAIGSTLPIAPPSVEPVTPSDKPALTGWQDFWNRLKRSF